MALSIKPMSPIMEHLKKGVTEFRLPAGKPEKPLADFLVVHDRFLHEKSPTVLAELLSMIKNEFVNLWKKVLTINATSPGKAIRWLPLSQMRNTIQNISEHPVWHLVPSCQNQE